jgi:hypothetical protein
MSDFIYLLFMIEYDNSYYQFLMVKEDKDRRLSWSRQDHPYRSLREGRCS